MHDAGLPLTGLPRPLHAGRVEPQLAVAGGKHPSAGQAWVLLLEKPLPVFPKHRDELRLERDLLGGPLPARDGTDASQDVLALDAEGLGLLVEVVEAQGAGVAPAEACVC